MIYTEDALVEQPAIKLFADLDWDMLNYWEETFGAESLFGCENRGDVNKFYASTAGKIEGWGLKCFP
jgi:type I restriction enzyme R subunit